jgi:copper oxidase (laccase) domain-containing protein
MGLAIRDDPVAVVENRRRGGWPPRRRPGDFVFTCQMHGRGVRVVDASDRGTGAFAYNQPVPEADILVTADTSIVLAILTADCLR